MADLSLPDAQTVVKTGKTYARDLLERVLATFLQAFIGGIVVTQPLDASMWYAALTGGVGAVLALAKGLVARWRSLTNSASLAKGV
jgi:heme A synthase